MLPHPLAHSAPTTLPLNAAPLSILLLLLRLRLCPCSRCSTHAPCVCVRITLPVSNADEPIWNKTPPFYYGIASPCIAAALLSHLAASLPCLRLSRPERMAITVECIYQNVGIGLSIAFSIFPMELGQSSKAAAVPLFYGFCQLVIIPLYVIICWRLGWSYAPSTDPIWDVLRDSYQHRAHYVDRPDPRTSIRGLTLEESSEPSPREAAESAI